MNATIKKTANTKFTSTCNYIIKTAYMVYIADNL